MAICGGCGDERTRIRTIFAEDGSIRKEECPSCAPGQFDPDWKNAKGATPWEAYPTKYVKSTMANGGTLYTATDEWRQDSEDKMLNAGKEEREKTAAAIEKKRQTRRTSPMTDAEVERATLKWRPFLEDKQEQANRSWNEAISQLTQ